MRDFTGMAPSFSIEWDVRPAYDFIVSLSPDTGKSDDLPAADRAWLAEALEKLPKAARDILSDEPRREILVHSANFIVDRRDLRSAADVVAGVKAATPADLFHYAFTETPDSDTTEIDQALNGDAAAKAAVRGRLKGHKSKAFGSILDDPATAHEQLVAVLEAWAVAFAEIEPRVSSILERDVELRAGDRTSIAAEDLVERTTGGIRIVPDPAIERVILAPSYFARPFNYLFAGPGWRFCAYPVADAALEIDPLQPPTSVLRLHQALGDATRLRILKALAEKDLYGTELAAQLDLSKPTVSHHMAQLRAAGLVTAVQAGSAVYYSLRRERLQDALTDLTTFLVG